MKGFKTLFIIPLLLIVYSTACYSDNSPSILVIKSSNNKFYNRMLEKLTSEPLNFSFSIKSINDSLDHIDPDLIISLGQKAHLKSRTAFPNTRKIFTFLTKKQSAQLDLKENELSLLLEQSTQRLLEFSKLLMPNKIIGIAIKNNNKLSVKKLLQDSSVLVNLVSGSDDLLSTLSYLIRTSDVLLAIPDNELYNRYTLKGVLISSYRSQIPLISYSPSHVKAGAIAALYTSPENIAEQILDILSSKSINLDAGKAIYSNYFSLSLNKRIANSLQIDLPSTKTLRKQMQQQGIQ